MGGGRSMFGELHQERSSEGRAYTAVRKIRTQNRDKGLKHHLGENLEAFGLIARGT